MKSGIVLCRRNSSMASLSQILHQDRHPLWLVDALILSAVAYSRDPETDLETLDSEVGLPATAKYCFLSEEELRAEGFESRKQALLVVKSISHGHMIIACRGTTGFADAFTDLNMMQRSMSLGAGSAHAGFLDRAKSIPLDYPRRQLIRGEHVVSGVLQVHRATIDMTKSDGARHEKDLFGRGLETTTSTTSSKPKMLSFWRKRESPKHFKSKVACLIFARRMQETNPAVAKTKKRKLGFVYENWGKLGRFARRWNGLFVASSIYYVVAHFRKFILWK